MEDFFGCSYFLVSVFSCAELPPKENEKVKGV